ncbi:hypothetical protein QQF64_027742 [Cirrhinus molitorella]|uniref:Uncharacterized protein n=1 Tax=Cirrhinus molitorella TaxID=172907 RepID=A0ABR3NDY1_9TELE
MAETCEGICQYLMRPLPRRRARALLWEVSGEVRKNYTYLWGKLLSGCAWRLGSVLFRAKTPNGLRLSDER